MGDHAADDASARQNMAQLVQLRWIAVAGQIVTVAVVLGLLGVVLPLPRMAGVLATLVALNLASILRLRTGWRVSNGELFLALLFDVTALTAQLYLSGGATNPFISLYLLQVTLGAVLLEVWSARALAVIAGLCFAGLTVMHHPLAFPQYGGDAFQLYIQGSLVCFLLDLCLLLVFITRISKNLRARDAHLARLRQQDAEQDLIVRMGLLASGAAHELGTPLATLSVILNDWRRLPALAADPEIVHEIDVMEAELQRCKTIVTGVLLSAGEARGESPALTTVRTFLHDVLQDWRAARNPQAMTCTDDFGPDLPIISDSALKQVIGAVLDNALEASPRWLGFLSERVHGMLRISVSDAGPGFSADMLADLGKPFRSTKGRMGGGLGLFLVFNVVRKLGGGVTAKNRPEGGAIVQITLPLAALTLGESDAS